MKEVGACHYAGPYEKLPFSEFIQLPIGLVPKAGNKTRLIFHLSYDFGPEISQKSFNFHTLPDMCKVKNRDLDHLISDMLKLIGDMVKMGIPIDCLYFGKSDLYNAFRLIPGLVTQ